ncbi:MAG TPA: tetratricopeptide repeat protein [Myxococcaceae bacterium]|nr:tetratricopeptide repeat protein [Myxococcaceae bacterium]
MAGESSSETSGLEETLGSAPRATEDSAPDAAHTGRIGSFRLVQLLGEGGMGEVWLAEQLEPRRRLALKLIKAGMDTRQVVARFESERQALALMEHPAIAKVFDGGSTPEGRPYFAMEYVPGVPITQHCDIHQLSTTDRLRLFIQVCEGVQHAHHKAIIHRDLKPSNILVSLVDGKPQAKIIDFGIAKATGYRLTEKTLFTEIGAFIGTPEYVSPEQANLTGQDVDTRTDVYSLGVVLYQLLTGELPFDSKELRSSSYEELRRKIREVDPPRPSTRVDVEGASSAETARNRRTEPRALKSQLQGDLDAITMKALEKDRARRYGTPSELAQDIERYLRHEPVVARPHSRVYRLRKYLARHRLGVSVAAGVAALLVAFSVAMAFQLRRTAQERDRADRERQASDRTAAFLSRMLSSLKPEALGKALWSDLHQRVAAVRRTRGATDEEVAQAMARVDRELGGVNPTETAVHLLDGQILEGAGEALAKDRGMSPGIAGRLEDTLALSYYNLGLYPKAEHHARRAVQLHTESAGSQGAETLGSMGLLANALDAAGKRAEAERLDREIFEARRRTLGPEHPDTLKSENNLAVVYTWEQRLPDAEQLLAELVAIRKRLNGLDHHDTLQVMNNLADVYYLEGRYPEAERIWREVVSHERRVLGEDNPDTLQAMGNLGVVTDEQGRHAEAEQLQKSVLAAQRRVLGPDHPDTLGTVNNLARVYWNEGRDQEAEALGREAIAGYQRTKLDPGFAIGDARLILGGALVDLKQYAQAEPELVTAERLITDDPHDHARCIDVLIALYRGWEQADPGHGHAAQAARWEAQRQPR